MTHHHHHHHHHPEGHAHPAAPPPWSLMRLSALVRVAGALVAIALIWAATVHVMG